MSDNCGSYAFKFCYQMPEDRDSDGVGHHELSAVLAQGLSRTPRLSENDAELDEAKLADIGNHKLSAPSRSPPLSVTLQRSSGKRWK